MDIEVQIDRSPCRSALPHYLGNFHTDTNLNGIAFSALLLLVMDDTKYQVSPPI